MPTSVSLKSVNTLPTAVAKMCRHFWFVGSYSTPPNSEIICGQNVGTKVVCGKIFIFEKKAILKI